MRQITIYKFSELSKKVQKKLLVKYRDINVRSEWWGPNILEPSSKERKQAGISQDVRIYKYSKANFSFIKPKYLKFEGLRIVSKKSFEKLLFCKHFTFEQYCDLKLKALQERFDYLISDAGVRQTIEYLRFEFTKDGELV